MRCETNKSWQNTLAECNAQAIELAGLLTSLAADFGSQPLFYAGSIAQFMVKHPEATRLDILDYEEEPRKGLC